MWVKTPFSYLQFLTKNLINFTKLFLNIKPMDIRLYYIIYIAEIVAKVLKIYFYQLFKHFLKIIFSKILNLFFEICFVIKISVPDSITRTVIIFRVSGRQTGSFRFEALIKLIMKLNIKNDLSFQDYFILKFLENDFYP